MTKKIAFLFPGQGSQSVGMGKEFYDNYESAKNVFDTADKVLGKSITNICFEGPEEELKQTVNTQPSIEQFNALENGVKIEDDFVTSPSKIDNKKKLDNGTYQFDITIHEGKNRQVRKMVNDLLKGNIGISQFFKFLHDNNLETKVNCINKDVEPSVLDDFIGDTLCNIFCYKKSDGSADSGFKTKVR